MTGNRVATHGLTLRSILRKEVLQSSNPPLSYRKDDDQPGQLEFKVRSELFMDKWQSLTANKAKLGRERTMLLSSVARLSAGRDWTIRSIHRKAIGAEKDEEREPMGTYCRPHGLITETHAPQRG